jgi:hypothetical protein
MHQTDLCLGMREILGRSPLFDPSQQPPRHQPEVEEKMILQVTKTTHKDQALQLPPQPQITDLRMPATAAAHHGSYASAPPRKSSDPRLSAAPTTLLPLQPSTACARRHEIVASPRGRCMPPLPSAVWQIGAATAASAGGGSGRGDGQRMWRLGLVWGLRCRPSRGGLVAV